VSALPAELMLDPVRQIDGFVHACLVDATSGMILSSLEEQDGMRLPVAAAGATDVINVLSLMTGELAADGDVEDVIVTLQSHYLLIRLLRPGPGQRVLLLVTLARPHANMAMAHREIRDFSKALCRQHDWVA
jgi:hypothetical protein